MVQAAHTGGNVTRISAAMVIFALRHFCKSSDPQTGAMM